MGYPSKIVTCCYCGTRAALVLSGTERHELACSSCGAPLHELKQLPVAKKKKRETTPDYAREPWSRPAKVKRKKPKKKKKSLFQKAMGEAFDLIEDIFD